MSKALDTSSRKCREMQTLFNSTYPQREIATIAVSKSVVNRIKIKIEQNKPLKAGCIRKCDKKRIITFS